MRHIARVARWHHAVARISRAATGAALIALALLPFAGTVPAAADTVSVGQVTDLTNWSGAGSVAATTTTSTSPPLEEPIYECAASLTPRQVASHEEADAYAQCTIQLDEIDYQWTWIDELTGAVLYSSSGSLVNTMTLSTAVAVYSGTPGHRTVRICYESILQGYVMTGNRTPCNEVNHV